MVKESPKKETHEWIRWAVALIVASLASIVASYYTTTSTIDNKVTEVKATENAHFGEVLRRLDDLKQDVREARRDREPR